MNTETPQDAAGLITSYQSLGLIQPRLVRLAWSAPAPPCEECRYDHTRAETPFGPFLLTWKGWKKYGGVGFDETPWGEVEYGWNTVEEAQAWAESEMERRIKVCLANVKNNRPTK